MLWLELGMAYMRLKDVKCWQKENMQGGFFFGFVVYYRLHVVMVLQQLDSKLQESRLAFGFSIMQGVMRMGCLQSCLDGCTGWNSSSCAALFVTTCNATMGSVCLGVLQLKGMTKHLQEHVQRETVSH